ncbi:SpoIIE family protein phosphatase [Streptacidiphilus sp. N1-3]|uniref:SpoIIE family protein phosphatase n=1 Tax=Streptacidiphilus alkalitolerans TaxID=3342712 RepID=A0ABV6XBD8_9ACTN
MSQPDPVADRPVEDRPAVVLVIDDNPTNRYILANWLQRAGHTVLEAGDGLGGLALLAPGATPRPELAIVDVRLPDLSGFEVSERIKSDPRTAGVPVIHVSAIAIATSDRTQGLYRGADAYLTEPIAPSELLATVTSALRYSRARMRAEQLARRLDTLNRATLDVYRAVDPTELAAAVARGARTLLQAPALVVTQPPDTDTVQLTHWDEDGRAVVRPAPPALLDSLAVAALGAGVGVGSARYGVQEWADLLARNDVRSPAPGGAEVTVVAARTKRGRPPVCVALHTDAETSEEDRDLVSQFTQASALALEALRSYTEEHTLSVTLQRALLPRSLPEPDGIRLAMRYLPATRGNEIGGDFYEAIETPAGLLLAVGDVVGHSLQAAVVMGELRHALRLYAHEGHPPRTVLERLDALLDREWPGWTATVCIVLVDPDRTGLSVANAGHLPPLLLDPLGEGSFVHEHGPMLGMGLPQPPSAEVRITAGTRLLLVTDGLIETRDKDLTTSLEELRTAAGQETAGPDALCEHLLRVFGAEQSDDVVLFAAEVTDQQV